MARSRTPPERTCVGCRIKAAKRELVRIVGAAEIGVMLDPTGKAPGRGAYVHLDPGCMTAAIRRGALARALRTSLGPAEAGTLQLQIEALAAQRARAGGPATEDER